jgi:hypothetical protein
LTTTGSDGKGTQIHACGQLATFVNTPFSLQPLGPDLTSKLSDLQFNIHIGFVRDAALESDIAIRFLDDWKGVFLRRVLLQSSKRTHWLIPALRADMASLMCRTLASTHRDRVDALSCVLSVRWLETHVEKEVEVLV